MRRAEPLDSAALDQLYGLDPVFEPGSDTSGVMPEDYAIVACPSCGEPLDVRIDLTTGDRVYIEDCQVCCRPIEFSIEVNDDGSLKTVCAQRLD